MPDILLGDGPSLALDELLATRLLVQGASGSGKTYLLRRLLEQSAAAVQQIVLDPEGEFGYLCTLAGHTHVDAARFAEHLPLLATQARERRVSCVLDISGFRDPAEQVRAVAAYVEALFEAPRPHWHPCLVVIDEAHLFAGDGTAGDKATRQASLTALANLMCRGRKRGLAGILATQRVSKIAKSVVAEAGNVLAGRTLLDIDMRRAADLVGLPRQRAGELRDLRRGEFMALGPALASAASLVRVGSVAPSVALPATTSATPEPTPLPSPAAVRPIRLPPLLVSVREALAASPGLEPATLACLPGVLNPVHARGLLLSLVGLGLATSDGGRFLLR